MENMVNGVRARGSHLLVYYQALKPHFVIVIGIILASETTISYP